MATHMNEDQLYAVALAEKGHSFLLTGSCGTGKSYVLGETVRRLRAADRKVLLCASTGRNIKNLTC